eukprot:3176262-Amphidinium_carterae.1
MSCISSTCSRRPLVFAFTSRTACSAKRPKPFPELSPLLASLMMISTPSRLSSSPTRAFSATIECSPSLRRMTFVKPPARICRLPPGHCRESRDVQLPLLAR